ncbi:hypothetical protein HMPREF1092_03017 [Clostridium thermobutyricum]|uniref:HTH LytTR-type domain-containing protein n=1 Tax=Clostridium thermobutyricum TaxID=29372 RepID=N9WA22_9CLOT|nr:LytTR family DNA-binding domain-containing protein [Clostridium thermobutyricum]ENY99880.1 hypothetical protein HMPREF1092_03017 [Clostridium thermobutyricum]
MIKFNLIIKSNNLKEHLQRKIEKLFDKEDFIIVEDINIQGAENEIEILFFELINENDVKDIKNIKEKLQNIGLIFCSEREELVFEVLNLHPIHFIRVNKLKEDLDRLKEVIKDYIDKKEYIITFQNGGLTLRLNAKNIIYIESYGHYLTIYSKTGEYRVREKLNSVLEKLNSKILIRAHKSYLVNPLFIEKIEASTLTLNNKVEIPIGRTFKSDLILEYSSIVR